MYCVVHKCKYFALNTLSGTKIQDFTPKRYMYDEHPRSFYMGVPPPPGFVPLMPLEVDKQEQLGDTFLIVIAKNSKFKTVLTVYRFKRVFYRAKTVITRKKLKTMHKSYNHNGNCGGHFWRHHQILRDKSSPKWVNVATLGSGSNSDKVDIQQLSEGAAVFEELMSMFSVNKGYIQCHIAH